MIKRWSALSIFGLSIGVAFANASTITYDSSYGERNNPSASVPGRSNAPSQSPPNSNDEESDSRDTWPQPPGSVPFGGGFGGRGAGSSSRSGPSGSSRGSGPSASGPTNPSGASSSSGGSGGPSGTPSSPSPMGRSGLPAPETFGTSDPSSDPDSSGGDPPPILVQSLLPPEEELDDEEDGAPLISPLADSSLPPPGIEAVPEPKTLSLIVLGLICLAGWQRWGGRFPRGDSWGSTPLALA